MAGPPFEQAVRCLTQQFTKFIPHGDREVGIDFRRSQAGMSQQNLNDADVETTLQHVRREAMPQ